MAPGETILLRNGDLGAIVTTTFGMTITSLRRGSGPELLYSTTARTIRPYPLGARGEESAATVAPLLFGGWFEMNPTAGLPHGPRRAREYYHGEAVRRSWTVVDRGPDFVEAGIEAWSAPLTLNRRIAVHDGGVSATTTIRNTGDDSVVISPGEHPCFRRTVFAGGRIDNDAWADARRPPTPIPASPNSSSGNARLRGPTAVTLRAQDGRAVVVQPDSAAHDVVEVWWNFAPAPATESVSAESTSPDDWDCLAIEPLSPETPLAAGEIFTSTTTILVGDEWRTP